MGLIKKTFTYIANLFGSLQDPIAEQDSLTDADRLEEIQLAWKYHKNQMFDPAVANWRLYLSERGLYKHTRLVFNPVRQINMFYVDNIWQTARNDAFRSLVTPLANGTPEEIMAAVAQLDQWGNFQTEKNIIKQYAASTGSVLIEVVDDLNREKVLHNTVWAGYVKDLVLNNTGDVQSYAVEYQTSDDTGIEYTYRKEVDKESIRYFKDGKPFAYDDDDAEVANPYGFTPAVWIKHNDIGGTFGLPACQHLDKVNHVNSLACHLHDNIHKEIESAKILATGGTVKRLENRTGEHEDGTFTFPDPRLERAVLKTDDSNAKILDFSGLLKLAEAHPYLQDLLKSFTDDYPELQAEAIIQQNSQLSGAALERLLTPAQNRLDGVQANYNGQLIKLRQMQVAVAGFRTKNGWTQRTRQQALFNPFGLESYARGEIDFSLIPAKLITETAMEHEELMTKKAERSRILDGVVDVAEQLRVAGYTDDEIAEITPRIAEQRLNVFPEL